LLGARERLRSHVTEVLDIFRAVALDASARFESEDERYGRESAFFLTIEELHRLLSGKVPNLAHVVRQRRRQYERDRELPDPPSTFRGTPPASILEVDPGDGLTGLAASTGYVEGRARVAMTVDDAADLTAD